MKDGRKYPYFGVSELVYDINLNYLGVNPPLTPPVEGKSGGKKEEEIVVVEESFGVADFGYDLYFLTVAKLLNDKYLRFFSFSF
ncbi:MAG: hypothetical protein F6K39_00350 [Okeania sp. SIO3B3]|nr:hypothetical protein [Okeania sp. SIO3B3]